MAVQIRKAEDDSVRVSFPYDHERVGKIRGIPGHRWVESTKEWRLPGNEQTVFKLAELFAEDDIVFESGADWFIKCLMGEEFDKG